MNSQILKLAQTSNILDLLKQLRMGFEFEFQAFEGKTRDEVESDELDYDSLDTDALYGDSRRALDEASDSDILDHLPVIRTNTSDERATLIRLIKGLVDQHLNYWDFRQVVDNLPHNVTSSVLTCILDETEGNYREAWEQEALENDPASYYPGLKGEYEINLDQTVLELGTDQSVKGGEIRTLGGLTVGQWLKAAKQVLTQNFEVDEGCSFHIHLSVPGVKHSFGKRIQSDCMLYLLDNFKRLPVGVQVRLKKDASYKWAKFQVSTDKYSAVHWHPQGTLEFRLFGNICTMHEAITCLILAAEALRFAYQQIVEGTSGNWLDRLDNLGLSISSVASEVRDGKDLRQIVRETAKEQRQRPAA